METKNLSEPNGGVISAELNICGLWQGWKRKKIKSPNEPLIQTATVQFLCATKHVFLGWHGHIWDSKLKTNLREVHKLGISFGTCLQGMCPMTSSDPTVHVNSNE